VFLFSSASRLAKKTTGLGTQLFLKNLYLLDIVGSINRDVSLDRLFQ